MLGDSVARHPHPSQAMFFGPSLVAGLVLGRWSAVWLPLLTVTAGIALGVPWSRSDAPVAALVAGMAMGVLLRHVTNAFRKPAVAQR